MCESLPDVTLHSSASGTIDGETTVCAHSFHAALCAAGAAIKAVDAVVIGEEQIDNMSNLWKDEDKTTLYEYANGRSNTHKIAYYITILACK